MGQINRQSRSLKAKRSNNIIKIKVTTAKTMAPKRRKRQKQEHPSMSEERKEWKCPVQTKKNVSCFEYLYTYKNE